MGFTGLVGEVLGTYAEVLVPRALEAIRQSEATDPAHPFTWTLPAWLLQRCLRDLRGNAVGTELERRVREGRVTWHGLPLTTHTELFGLEDLVRGLYVARGLGQRFGRASVAAKMTDVPGHTWILPTLLAAAGVTFLHLGCNPCSTPPDVPRLFRWEGPDGSRVTTMYSQGGYGTPLLPPEDWHLPVWLALQHTSDNVGPQGAAVIPQVLAEVRSRFPRTEVRIGSLDDFARELSALKLDLPVIRKDLADSWIHGVGSMPAEVARLRELRNRLVQLESDAALRAPRDGGAPSAAEFAAAYESLLLFGEHTWGMDTKLALNPPEFGGRVYDKEPFLAVLRSGKYQRIVRSWDDKRAFVTGAAAQVGGLAGSTQGPPGVAEPLRLEIVNHHLWQWNGLVPLGACGDEISVVSEADGAALPAVVLDGQAWVRVTGLAPLSSMVIRARPFRPHKASGRGTGRAAWRAQGRGGAVLENRLVRVRMSREAGIVSLVDRRTGREWVERGSGMSLGAYRYDVYSRREIVSYLKDYAYDLQPWFLDDFGKPGYPGGEHRSFLASRATLRLEDGFGWARAHLSWEQEPESWQALGNARVVHLAVTLFDDLPFVDLSCTLEGKQACPLLEAGHLVMPLRARKPRYAVNKTGSVIDPATDIARNANRLLNCCERWVDVSDGGEGMLVMPLDSPLLSIGSPAIERFEGSGGPGAPALFFNLFNTQWGTNFPQWISGNLVSRFRLLPHQGDWRSVRAWEHAAEAFQPPSCRPAGAAAPDGAPLPSLLKVRGQPLETVTIKGAEDGSGLILRLRDPTGRAARRVLQLPGGARRPGRPRPQLVHCSLLEEELRTLALTASNGGFKAELSLRPFEIVTLKLKL